MNKIISNFLAKKSHLNHRWIGYLDLRIFIRVKFTKNKVFSFLWLVLSMKYSIDGYHAGRDESHTKNLTVKWGENSETLKLKIVTYNILGQKH